MRSRAPQAARAAARRRARGMAALGSWRKIQKSEMAPWLAAGENLKSMGRGALLPYPKPSRTPPTGQNLKKT